MSRLGELDLPARLQPTVPAWATQLGVGLLCAGSAVLLRALIDAAVTGGAPFALIYPALILATLFAGWRAGVVCGVTAIAYAWFFTFPVFRSFRVVDAGGAVAIGAIIFGAMLTVAIAELFRRATRAAAIERDREIADRDLLLAEFDHRVKNNFQIVAGILDIQRRRAGEGETADALGAALHRVESIARAHRHLYRGRDHGGLIEMRAYLGDLCDALSDALLLRGGVTLTCQCDALAVSRDRAVSIGLVVNELVTNAAKHAFVGREEGSIAVRFHGGAGGGGSTLVVCDDGVGIDPATAGTARSDGGGLGSRLIPAFARQAGGTIATESGPDGTTVTMELPA